MTDIASPQLKWIDAESALFNEAIRVLGRSGFSELNVTLGGKKARYRVVSATSPAGESLSIWLKVARKWPGKGEAIEFTWKKFEKSGVGSGSKAVEYSCKSAASRGVTHLLALAGEAESQTISFARLYSLEDVVELAYSQSLEKQPLIFDHTAAVLLQSFVPELDSSASIASNVGMPVLELSERQAEILEGKRTTVRRSGRAYRRDPTLRALIIKNADGFCELCGEEGFLMSNGGRYLEAHHLIEVAAHGPDSTENLIAVCAICHRKAHYSAERVNVEAEMMKAIRRRRRNDA